ncbi:HpcH/HpaI aldolase/citrate lyase family protein [Chloroflexota bacterium]
MEGNRFRQLIKSGRFTYGLGISIADPAIVELAAYSGFEFLLFAGKVPAITKRIEDLLRAAEAVQISPIFNVVGEDLDPTLIGQVLDLGADGVQFSLVSSRQRAEEIVRLSRIPPLGDREVFAGGRLGKYWGISMEEFTHRANEAVIVVKIETKKGLEHAEEILSVPGIDAVSVGQSDLSKTLGVGRDSPVIIEAQQHVMQLAKSNGLAFLQLAMNTDDLGEWVKREESLRLFYFATDGVQIGRSFRGLIQKSNEVVAQSYKGGAEGLVSRVIGSDQPWLTTQSN